MVVFVVATLHHLFSEGGFLASANATAPIRQAHVTSFLPKVDAGYVQQVLTKDVVLIDARLSRDYEAGHIKGAISVPVNATAEERRRIMADIPKDARIIVYCQSRTCPFDERVAEALLSDGYTNIKLFHGGWAAWEAAKDKEQSG